MFNAILFDLDGTIYRGKQLLPHAKETLETLRDQSTGLFFVTNASNRSRDGSLKKLVSFGINADRKEVINSAYATAIYISEKFKGKKVFCISEGGLHEEMETAGIMLCEDESAGVVAVGLDRNLTYEKLAIAHKAISNGAHFIASNDDPCFPVEDGFLPGAGAIVEAISKSTGKTPVLIGKPSSLMIDLVIKENRLDRNKTIIIGDRVETDILAGKNAGIKTGLVLTGVTKKGDIDKIKKEQRPDYVLDSLRDIQKLQIQ